MAMSLVSFDAQETLGCVHPPVMYWIMGFLLS